MTRLQILDGRREALPVRYWYSRIDTRKSVIASIFLEPGTPLKLTLSDSLIRKKMILTNSQPNRPEGVGYLVDDWPSIPFTEFTAARDMWYLLGPRIASLETHGIHNEKIQVLYDEGENALQLAESGPESPTIRPIHGRGDPVVGIGHPGVRPC